MTNNNFNDRPSNQRIHSISKYISDVETEKVRAFLDLQWTFREMEKQYDRVFSSFGLSESRFVLLLFLNYAVDHSLKPSELAEKLGASRATVSKLLSSMEQKNWVEKIHSNEDKRSYYFKLTESGKGILEKFLPHNFETVKDLTSHLDDDDIFHLNQILDKLNRGTKKIQEKRYHNDTN